LRITNGDANGQNRISSATIKLNGVQVAGPADFGQNVSTITRSVALSLNNTLGVSLASSPGAYLTITVTGTQILPVPTALAPNPLAITAGASGILAATLSPAPTSSGTLALSSGDSTVASVAASVPFAAGQTQVSIPIAGVGAGTTTVSASA